jgi:hypothetical protein
LEPSTPRRRSANSLIKFRARTKVSATNNKKMSAERPAKTAICWFESGIQEVEVKRSLRHDHRKQQGHARREQIDCFPALRNLFRRSVIRETPTVHVS